MEMLFGNGRDDNNQMVPYGENLMAEARPGFASGHTTSEESGPSIDVRKLIRRYILLLLALMILGAGAGFTSVVMSSPMYKARLLLEVQTGNEIQLNNVMVASNSDNDVNIQTQIQILRGGAFLKRGADRMQSETVPLAPTGRG